MIPVKICGITNLEDALTCVRHGASALGFIFAPSKRQVTVAKVYEISRQVPPFITKVGVFVNEDPLVIREILKDCHLDLAQLHGGESQAVTEFLPGRVIKAFKAGLDEPDLAWRDFPIRAILIDSFMKEIPGGTGQTFNWSLFQSFRSLGYPMILAGGLNPGNIINAVETARPEAIDLSSGVELKPGIKDPMKIKQLMANLKSADIQGA
ncbi:MAG TPA: N-(5'-phosphoribosyl)anthranilate isomerase [Firmicutes bacterium]|jgi:phosphoribosylanthranilate isomerase|nr:N-(5'-phosphoribosyl)anthranilate isomerase [Bacillota bacterium]